ncbi:eukaryotic translation initiation factor 4G-like isoform X1 [Rhododendron vialii]|uniref:eukaryotic translation initiation factor 4G-like isoform X1 n=1 Tax=Rhododendron vialii TaxID=182163 RepID=UPI00265F0323|nr:eukaryotic translation initiation factor 4G-like isoform X1 [Rhododendron vialii]XP_058224938.1 eukaryotic translation initiation factor 4G-like isoform X1 [Rhododendron vialii]
MSFNQSRADRSDSSQYRKSGGRSGTSAQPRNFSGGSGKGGGGPAPPPSSTSTTSSLSSNRSFKKPNNAQGGQSRVSGVGVNPDSSYASAARTLQNGTHLQPSAQADAPVAGVPLKPTADMATQKSTQAGPKAPSSQPAIVNSDSTPPATPAKPSGEASKSFPLQFGSISPGFVNGMQIPARTNSAPPNLDEQQRDQVRHDSQRTAQPFPIPSVPKKQMPRKDGDAGDQSITGEARQMAKPKRDVQFSSVSPVTQTQKTSVHHGPGVSMPMPFHQPQGPVQPGGPKPPIQSQGMASPSLPVPMPMPMPMPLPMGNAPQLQQSVFLPSLQPHPMQPPGIMHQGQSLNFPPQMGPHMPQLGNLGISIGSPFAQHQAGNYGVQRKPVKITHPDTHEELRLVGSSGTRSHPNVPQSQPITPISPARPINYYPNPYNLNSHFFPAPSSVPLSSTQINPSSQAPRFSYPPSQSTQTPAFVNPSAHNSYSYSSKTSAPLHGASESSSLEHSRGVHSSMSSAPPASVQVTIKQATGLSVEKIADSSQVVSSASIEKGETPTIFQQPGEDGSLNLQSNSDASQQPKRSLEPTSSSVTAAVKESTAASPSVDAPLEKSAPVVTNSTENRRQTICRADSIKDQQKKIKKGFSLPHHQQVPGQSSSISSLSSQSSELTNSFTRAETMVTASSSNGGGTVESAKESLSTHSTTTADAPEFKTDSGQQGSTCESSETLGSFAIVDSLETDNHARKNDSSPDNEPLKLETMGTKDSEAPKEDKYRSESSAESVCTKSTELVNQTELNSGVKVTNNLQEFNPEIAGKDSEEPLGHCMKDDVVADELVIPTSLAPDDTNDKTSPSSNSDSKTSISDVSCSRSDSLGGRQAVVTKSVLSDEGEAPVSAIPSVSERPLESEGEGTEYGNVGLVSLPAAASKDKPVVELSRSKSNFSKGKKKRKEILQKADALGTTSDLYMAYKGPEEKNETVASLESTTSASSVASKQEFVDTMQDDIVLKKGQHKFEPDDWEDADDFSTPRLEAMDDGKQVDEGLKHHSDDGNGVMTNKYSRDFLLKFSEQFSELPEGLEITSDIAEAFMASNLIASRESHPSPGRIIDRPSSVSRLDRRGSGLGGDDKWNKLPGPPVSGQDSRVDGYGGNFRPGQVGNYGVLRNPRAQTPPQYVGGILSGPVQSLGSQGGVQRNTPDSDRWQRASSFQKGLIPSPQTPLQVMHKAEKKYEVGKVTDEEMAKQRQLKAILNKLTPQNFEKLFEQVKAVNIDSADTLAGVISQIFDKALMEPTFCEMYANFCHRLAGELPDFSEDDEKITFKRLLLNKCQEEFERDAREQEETDRADEEGEVKQSEGKREEKRIQARRRMLGNIRLIGELFKKGMLTERIMHECIKKLLGQYQNPEGQYQNPDEEDIEALCKLMSTIGEMIDRPKAKDHMDAYFDMMAKLSNDMKLSSRLRFMLKDSIDLRKNKWQQRRKVEGPKKIEEVHRDAAQERHVQAGRLARAPSMNSSVRNRQLPDFGPRGSGMLSSPNTQMGSLRGLPPQLRSHGIQDARMEDRHSFENRVLSVPLPQRPIVEDSITLGPQGGLARGMSIRGQPSMPTSQNGYSSVPEKTVYSSRDDLIPRYMTDRFGPSHDQSIQDRNVNFGNRELRNADRSVDRSRPISPIIHSREQTRPQSISSVNVFPEEILRDKSIAAIKEFYSAKDEKEVAFCIKELNAPSFYPRMISIWVTDSFERKDMERDLLATLLVNLSKSQDAMLNGDHLIKGFESVLATLEDAVNDAPKAGEFLGRIFAKIIIEHVIPFKEVGQLILEGGEEPGSLVEMGLAAEVVGTILETIKVEKGDSGLNEVRSSSSLKIEKFRPPDSRKPLRLDKFI